MINYQLSIINYQWTNWPIDQLTNSYKISSGVERTSNQQQNRLRIRLRLRLRD